MNVGVFCDLGIKQPTDKQPLIDEYSGLRAEVGLLPDPRVIPTEDARDKDRKGGGVYEMLSGLVKPPHDPEPKRRKGEIDRSLGEHRLFLLRVDANRNPDLGQKLTRFQQLRKNLGLDETDTAGKISRR